ncbi:hypothetical protein GQ600_22418 [Phytophthora cactorum]|nr:hypothetical protein GQ600_22418 [Phytophthora cactorum]
MSSLETRFSDRPLLQILKTATKFPRVDRLCEGFQQRDPKKQESWFEPLRLSHDVDWIIKKAMENPSTVETAKLVQSAWVKRRFDTK